MIKRVQEKDIRYLLNLYHNNLIDKNCKKIGQGLNSIVYKYKKYAIKVFIRHAKYKDDHKYLAKLQGCRYFPKMVYCIPQEIIIMKYMKTKFIYSKKKSVFKYLNPFRITKSKFINQSNEAINFALNQGIIMNDIVNNIFTSRNHLVFIDVGCFLFEDEMNNQENVNKVIKSNQIKLEVLSKRFS